MTQSEFIEATSRVERYYDKEYTTEQRKIMYEFLKEWSKERYVKTINYCIRNTCKYLPKLTDLTNVDINEKTYTDKAEIDFVRCNKCNGEGFVQYYRNQKDGDKTLIYEYVALCTCENAKKQRIVNGYDLPTLAELGL